jgi:XrtN system VIT domain protein
MGKFHINKTTLIGLIAIAISTITFLIPEMFFLGKNSNIFGGTILIHYSIAILYVIYTKIERLRIKQPFFKHERKTGTLTGILFWISCFALNREIPLFHESTDWLSVLISICTLTLLVEVFFTFTNKYLQIAYALLSGITSILLFYYSVYLLPMWFFGLIGIILIGLGGHVFVPFFMLLNQIKLIKKLYETSHTAIAYSLGLIIPIASALVFTVIFSSAHSKLQHIVSEASTQKDLPTWVYVSQHTPKTTLNSLVLRKALIYPYFRWAFGDMPSQNKREEKRHNPALIVADMFNSHHKKDNKLSVKDRINILASDYEEHNEEEERLWRGCLV